MCVCGGRKMEEQPRGTINQTGCTCSAIVQSVQQAAMRHGNRKDVNVWQIGPLAHYHCIWIRSEAARPVLRLARPWAILLGTVVGQILISPSETVLCLTGTQHALVSPDTRQCPTVTSKSVCSHSNCTF